MKRTKNATADNNGQQEKHLTLAQQNAIDALVAGKNDRETAELVKLNRVTVTKWRLYSPKFQAALNQRRAEVWGSAIDRLRSLVPRALDALAEALDSEHLPLMLEAARDVLRIARIAPDAFEIGPTDPTDIVREVAEGRLEHVGESDEYLAEVRDELEALASE